MATNRKIQTSELDFDAIKDNLKEYLRGQDQFSDYDFEGSGLSVLLDVLAYNTHYNALYTNLAINEAFLDSASKRSSVVSKAKELGYVGQSARAATAVVNLTLINNQISAPTFYELGRYTPFQSIIDGVNYTFYTTQNLIAYRNGNQYIFENITLKEGNQLQYRYTVQENSQFIIPNTNVDLSTVRVTVQENGQSSSFETYVRSDSIINVSPDSLVYFVKELDNGLYELEFGNNVIGKALVPGNVVTIEYIVTNGEAANGARTFTYNGTTIPNTQPFVVTVNPSFGGAAAEDIDEIKWNAPRAYAAQNRCVTAEDYKTLIKQYYPDARSINVWGGETASPPQYGKVFISIISESASVLSDGDKQQILNEIINPRKVVTVTPEFVDPSRLEIQLDVTVFFDPQNTTRSSADITSIVQQTIIDYNNSTLNSFEGVFKLSQLSRLIDTSEPSITNNVSKIKIHRTIQPVFNNSVGYVVNLGNPILKTTVPSESVLTTGFFIPNSTVIHYIDDVPDTASNDLGTLRLFYRADATGEKVVVQDIGTVNYTTGSIRINDLNITRLATSSLDITIIPKSYDVISTQNLFVVIGADRLSLSAAPNTTSSYTFVSNRF